MDATRSADSPEPRDRAKLTGQAPSGERKFQNSPRKESNAEDDDEAEGDAAPSSIVLADPNTPSPLTEAMNIDVTYPRLSDVEAKTGGAILLSGIGLGDAPQFAFRRSMQYVDVFGPGTAGYVTPEGCCLKRVDTSQGACIAVVRDTPPEVTYVPPPVAMEADESAAPTLERLMRERAEQVMRDKPHLSPEAAKNDGEQAFMKRVLRSCRKQGDVGGKSQGKGDRRKTAYQKFVPTLSLALAKEKMPGLFVTQEGTVADPCAGTVELGYVPKRPNNADGKPFIGALFPRLVRFSTANAAGIDGRHGLTTDYVHAIFRGEVDAPDGLVVRHVDESWRQRLVDELCVEINQSMAWGA